LRLTLRSSARRSARADLKDDDEDYAEYADPDCDHRHTIVLRGRPPIDAGEHIGKWQVRKRNVIFADRRAIRLDTDADSLSVIDIPMLVLVVPTTLGLTASGRWDRTVRDPLDWPTWCALDRFSVPRLSTRLRRKLERWRQWLPVTVDGIATFNPAIDYHCSGEMLRDFGRDHDGDNFGLFGLKPLPLRHL